MQTNKQQVQALQAAISAKLKDNSITLDAFFHPDAVWHLPRSTAANGGGDMTGKAAVLAMFNSGVANFYIPESMDTRYHSTIAEGDLVHSRFTLKATTAQGKHYENDYQALYRLEDGLVIEVWEYFDTAHQFAIFAAD